MPELINITPENLRCSFGGCPAVYVDLTPESMRCDISASCPAVLTAKDATRFVIIGTRLDPEDEGLSGKVSETESAVEISAELLLASLGVEELVKEAKFFAQICKLFDETESDDCSVEVKIYAGKARMLRSALSRIQGGGGND